MKFRITEDTKITQILEHYPQVEEIFKEYFKYFYENRLEDIVLKRLSLKGAFNILEYDTKKREEVLSKIFEIVEDINNKNKFIC